MGDIRAAFDAAVEANGQVGAADGALVEAGRTIADQLDVAAETMTGQDLTKALYLTPHLVNILKEMLATPAARKAAGLTEKEAAGGKLAHLQSVSGKKKRTA